MWGTGDVAFFDRLAAWYDRLHPTPDESAYRRAFDAADRPVETVLDVAGGTGRVARVLEERTLVVDLSLAMLRRALAHADAVRGDAGRLPVRSGSVDAVLCVDAFHHLPAPEASLEEADRVLGPGGVLVLVDFDPDTVLGRVVALAERAVGMGSTFRSRRAVVDAVEATDLAVVRVEAGWATYRLVARRSAPPG